MVAVAARLGSFRRGRGQQLRGRDRAAGGWGWDVVLGMLGMSENGVYPQL